MCLYVVFGPDLRGREGILDEGAVQDQHEFPTWFSELALEALLDLVLGWLGRPAKQNLFCVFTYIPHKSQCKVTGKAATLARPLSLAYCSLVMSVKWHSLLSGWMRSHERPISTAVSVLSPVKYGSSSSDLFYAVFREYRKSQMITTRCVSHACGTRLTKPQCNRYHVCRVSSNLPHFVIVLFVSVVSVSLVSPAFESYRL